ncbi:MAG: hypothetical protein IPQ16_10215 [Geobacteraceae bacterium]|nr:hypothetical protein [Geobacteraceae bacterium]
MKKILTLLVAALTAVSFASVAMADHHMKKEEVKPAEAAAPAAEKKEGEKKDVKKEKKAKKAVKKKEGEAKPAVKGKKEVSGC